MKLNLEAHIIQSFPVSNLNRDDSGSPKDCVFGGTRRGRISSQCLKRSIRNSEAFTSRIEAAGGDVGKRSKMLKGKLVDKLVSSGITDVEKASALAEAGIKALGLAFDKKNTEKTEYLLYFGTREIDELGAIIAEPATQEALMNADLGKNDEEKGKSKKKAEGLDPEIKKSLTSIIGSERLKGKGYAADIALFGRMMADDKDMNVNASCQVAHAISTHRVETVFDYYTAVDDFNTDDAGAGMVGIQEYNSACYYRYANVSLDGLCKNLGGDVEIAKAAALGFAEAMVKAVPTGKQNSTAAFTPPTYIRFIVRNSGSPQSLAGAFSAEVKPSPDGDHSIERLSVDALKKHYDKLASVYGKNDVLADIEVDIDDPQSSTFADAMGKLEATIAANLQP
jgi:CRISPR system Cascade subunit CasC